MNNNLVLGVKITNDSEDKILKYILLSLKNNEDQYYIVTPNPEILVYAYDHPKYKKILNEARISLPDGVGLFIASGLMGNAFNERITGVDFMIELCRMSLKKPIRVGFLGGRKGVAKRTAECLKRAFPKLEVGFVGEEWSHKTAWGTADHFPSPMASFASRAPGARLGFPKRGIPDPDLFMIDILFVAFGHPKQEEWIYEHLHELPVKIAMGVGGAFDYISGEVNRAPFMVRAMGFEWMYRLIREPWRWRRQLSLPRFVWLVLREMFGNNR